MIWISDIEARLQQNDVLVSRMHFLFCFYSWACSAVTLAFPPSLMSDNRIKQIMCKMFYFVAWGFLFLFSIVGRRTDCLCMKMQNQVKRLLRFAHILIRNRFWVALAPWMGGSEFWLPYLWQSWSSNFRRFDPYRLCVGSQWAEHAQMCISFVSLVQRDYWIPKKNLRVF